MKRVYVDLDDALKLITSQAKQNLQWIEDNGKLDAFYNLVDEMFDDNVKIYAGHGDSSTVAHEKKYNPAI